jgi:hypothetical protein
MEEVWGAIDDFTVDMEEISDVQTFVIAGGQVTPIEPGTSFKEVVLNAADTAGYGKFRVLLNGEEIRPSAAPTVFEEGFRVEIRPYDVAG